MGYLAALLALLCLLLCIRLYSLERNLKEGMAQLRTRRAEKNAAPLRLAAPHKTTEALLSEVNELLREAEEERSDFRRREQALRRQIANVSHDLRTPLTSILGYLQLLGEEELTEEQRRQYLDIIAGRARVLQGLITSFYDLSRLEAGEYPILRERVDLKEVIGELLAAFYDELEARFQVEVDLPDGLPMVWGDRGALTRVYSNLIRNALEHGSGTLKIAARQVQKDAVETRFTNGGADLTREDLPHVFDRFFTTDQTRSGRNTGLGLAIVRALAEQMDGAAGTELRGQDFTVILTWRA